MNALAIALVLMNAAPDTTVPESEKWRAERPKPAEAKPPKLPSFERTTLDNGLTILVATVDAVPVASFSLVTKGGALLDPKPKAGLASLSYSMLGEGTKAKDTLAFSDAVADLGASFGSSGDRDRGAVSISGLAKNGDAMLALLAEATLSPRLAAKDFERLKKQRIGSLLRRRGSPQGLAFERVPALIYGADHPYGHPPSGTVETINAIAHEDVAKFLGGMLAPQRSALVAAGSLTVDEVRALAEKHLGTWKAEVPEHPAVPAAEAKKRDKIILLDKPGAPQTMTIVGRPVFERGHPDQPALAIANEVYGGSFSSRLNMNLREAKSITYGAGSQAAFRQGTGVFLAYSAIRADATAVGLGEIFGELERMVSNPPSAEEVESARSGMIRSLSGSFERSGSIAGAAGNLFVYGLPLDYYATLGAKYEAVKLEDVHRAAKTYMTPEHMQVLMVGDTAVIAKDIEALGRGKLDLQKP